MRECTIDVQSNAILQCLSRAHSVQTVPRHPPLQVVEEEMVAVDGTVVKRKRKKRKKAAEDADQEDVVRRGGRIRSSNRALAAMGSKQFPAAAPKYQFGRKFFNGLQKVSKSDAPNRMPRRGSLGRRAWTVENEYA